MTILPQQPKLPPKPSPPSTPSSPDGLTPTRKLLKDIIDAGGVLDRDIRDDNANYRTLVGIINRRQMAPDGQQVIMIDGLKPLHIMGGFIRSVQHPVILGGCDIAWLSGAEVGEA